MSAQAKSPRRKPLYVGVTGHRPNRMPEREWPRIRRTLADVMADIEKHHPRRTARLVSGLAEGADRIAAHVALGLGWSLDAILAFHRARFEKDFPEAHAVDEFRALLAAASTVKEPTRRWHVGRPAEDGYSAMAATMLAMCEVLIAVWDGEGSRGKGGTIEVIDEARRRGLQVIWVHATKPEQPRTLVRLRPRNRATTRQSGPAKFPA